jgi:flagellar motor protein MotB
MAIHACSRGAALCLALLAGLPVTHGQAESPAGVSGPERTADVAGLQPGGECPDPGPGAARQIAAAASATIPLKEGVTFSSVWKRNTDDYEHECLEQITAIDARSILTTSSCPVGPRHEANHRLRRICWSDLLNSHLYVTEHNEGFPETFVGALAFSLSLHSFADLKGNEAIAHRYIEPRDDFHFIAIDIDGQLKSDGAGTFKVIVNDRVLEVPTIEASYINQRKGDIIRVKVLDDGRFPLMLDYYIPTLNKFFVTYTKVSFPTAREIEEHLAVDKRTDVYGIYFDFASDSIRSESLPVLREIADAMKSHPEWSLIVNGHTDNIGNAAQNLDLSQRRALTVRKVLIDQFKIASARLSTNGFGASQPKESNDTDRGRARNRRVELIRQ